MISLGMSSIHPTGPLRRRIMSPTLAYVSPVPWEFGVNIMRMAVVWLQSSSGLWCGLKDPVRYPFLEDSNGDGPHTQIRLNLSKTDVPQAETNRAQQSIKWYRRWAFYGHKGLFECPVRHLP